MFKVFPCGSNKIPLIKGWQLESSSDPEKLQIWANLFRGKMAFWGLPTGHTNDILALDVDVKGDNGFETLKTMHVPATLSQRTPSGGGHFLYRYPKDGKTYGNRVKFMPGLDTRGEGGYVCVYGFDSTPIADPPNWLLQQAPPQLALAPGASIKVAPEIAARIIEVSLENIRNASEGESNNVLNIESFKVGQLVASGSITMEYAEAALFRAALERGKPQYEAKATIASGLNGGSKKPLASPFGTTAPVAPFGIPAPPVVTRWTPQKFTRADLESTHHLRRPQLFEHWSTQDIHITTADGGTGKSTMKLYESICLALGERFLGFRCLTPGRTLYVTGEDTAEKLGAMIGQILKQMGLLEDPEYNDKVQLVLDSIIIKKDADLCLIVKDRATGFLHPNLDALRKLYEAVDDFKPKMIVLDPISSFWGSESALNDMNKAVIKFVSQLAEYSGACVEMINHAGKVSSASKDMSQFAGRGGTGLPSNARVCRTLRTVLEDEYTELTGGLTLGDKQSAILCRVNKFTDGSPLYNKDFLILRDGYLFMRKPMTDQKIKEAQDKLTDIERVFAYIKECRQSDKYPSLRAIVGHFQSSGDKISTDRVKNTMELLAMSGHMGELVKVVENPDQTSNDKVYVITDMDGKES